MSTHSRKKIILKTLKIHKTIWHPESTLVYKSRKERIVIGRLVDGEIIPLDSEALELCEEWGAKFPPDESLIGNEQETESNEEDEQESNDGEQQEDEEQESNDGETESNEKGGEEMSDTDLGMNNSNYEECFKSFITEVRSMSNKNESRLLAVYAELKTKSDKINVLEAELETKLAELAESELKYNGISKKFDAMKSLFA